MTITSNDAIRIAYDRGYRVLEDGTVLNHAGKPMKLRVYKDTKYPQLVIRVDKSKSKTIRIHRLAAYCFYGEALFDEGIEVRHLNANVFDVSKANIALGTHRENELDKPPEIRKKKRGSPKRKAYKRSLRRLNDTEVLGVKFLLYKGKSMYSIGKIFGLSTMSIKQIKLGESYADIKLFGEFNRSDKETTVPIAN